MGLLEHQRLCQPCCQFNEWTGRNYSHVQKKNRWDALKGDYTIWKTLLLHASGLERDLNTSSISASNEWWEEKITVCTITIGNREMFVGQKPTNICL
jgi:hypothetical protein